MKIYCNAARPEIEDGHWINPTFETPDEYTMIETFTGGLDVRVSSKGEVAVFISDTSRLVYKFNGKTDVTVTESSL